MKTKPIRILASFILITLLLPLALGAFSVGHECACQAREIADGEAFCDCSICAAVRSAFGWLKGLILFFALRAALPRVEHGVSRPKAFRFRAFSPVKLFVRMND